MMLTTDVQYLLLSQLQVESIVSNAYWDAWASCYDEWRLYPVINIPMTFASATMEFDYPHASIITIPQAVFDPLATERDQSDNPPGDEPAASPESHPPSNPEAGPSQPDRSRRPPGGSRAVLTGQSTERLAAVSATEQLRAGTIFRDSASPSPAPKAARSAAAAAVRPAAAVKPVAAVRSAAVGRPVPAGGSAAAGGPVPAGGSAAAGGSVPAGGSAAAGGPVAAAVTSPKDLQGDIPKKIPDIARIIRYTKNVVIPNALKPFPPDKHVDAVEQKCLNYRGQWNTYTARCNAEELIGLHVEQLYDTAMAALATHPKWTKFTVNLIIGIYFTQLEWTRPDAADHKAELEAVLQQRERGLFPFRPRPHVSTIPSTPPPTMSDSPVASPVPLSALRVSPFTPSLANLVSQKNHNDLHAALDELLRTSRKRSMPKMYYWNECALEFVMDDVY